MQYDRRPKQEVLVGADIEKYAGQSTVVRSGSPAVTTIIQSLTPLEQELYVLRFIERESLRNIARHMGWASDNTVRYHLKKIYAAVKKGLE